MSKHETKMTQWYAKTRYPKGFLMEEYLALKQGKKNGKTTGRRGRNEN